MRSSLADEAERSKRRRSSRRGWEQPLELLAEEWNRRVDQDVAETVEDTVVENFDRGPLSCVVAQK